MATATTLPPNPNSESSLAEHRHAVFSAYGKLFVSIDAALSDAVPKAHNVFGLFGGAPDRAVHATMTRYIVRSVLSSSGFSAEDEVPSAELEWVPNCGICVRTAGLELRLLKAANGAIPKANSDTRTRFYCSNQLSLFERITPDLPSALKLVALWDVDDKYNYLGLSIACPRGEMEDHSVDCFWHASWSDGAARRSVAQDGDEEGDLEIKPVDNGSRGSE